MKHRLHRSGFGLKSTCKLLVLLAVVLSIATGGCQDYQRLKQVRTFADMQGIVRELEELRTTSISLPSESQLATVVAGVAGGEDAWGNAFRLKVRQGETGWSYVLVSFGSDGKAELGALDEYFQISEEFIDGQPERDIVFRDGQPVRNAGK